MSARCLKSTVAQSFFKSGAGLAPAGGFEDCTANAEAASLQTEEIDPGNGNVPPHIGWADGFVEQTGKHLQVLPLDQRDLSGVTRSCSGVIAGQSRFSAGLNHFQSQHLGSGAGSDANPCHAALLGDIG